VKHKSTLKLKVVFTCADFRSSSEDVFELGVQLQALLKKFKGKSTMEMKELSIANSDPIPQLAAQLKKLSTVSKNSRKK